MDENDRKSFSHDITVNRPLKDAIHLFTPKGEEAWVPGWRPAYIAPASGETAEEMLFTTGSGDGLSFWTCLAWRPDAGHARYLCLTPATRAAFIDVRCRAAGNGATRVRVAYDHHALTEAGRRELAEMTETDYAASITAWADRIHAAGA